MKSFWDGFEKRALSYDSEKTASVRSLGYKLGRKLQEATQSLSNKAKKGSDFLSRVKNAPRDFKEGIQRGKTSLKNEVSLSNPVQKKRREFPRGIKPKTSASTKARHYKDVRQEKGLPAYGADKKKTTSPNSPVQEKINKIKDYGKKNKDMLIGATGGGIVGSAASSVLANKKQNENMQYYR